MKKKTVSIIVVLLAVLAFVLAEFFVVRYYVRNHTQPEYRPVSDENAETTEKNSGTISIPGFESITLTADSTSQLLQLKNPAQNNCYFVISIWMNDGSLLWQSDLIEPGYQSNKIKLNFSLPEGIYPDCILKYDCYAMDDSKTPLNGAETKITIFAR